MIFQISAILDGVKTLKNNTLRIGIETQDINNFKPEELAELFRLNDKHVWVGIKETPIAVEDVEIKEPIDKGDKTPAQRLRSVIYILWEKEGKKGDYETYYKGKMEKLIDWIKDKLN
jgi:hypothetical protein